MSRAKELIDLGTVERGRPLEFAHAIPLPVQRFAKAIIEHRALPAPALIKPLNPSERTLSGRLREELDPLTELVGFDDFAAWIAHWSERFARLTGGAAVSVRLFQARGPTCPRFHIDQVSLRLIAALEGPGSDWLRPEDVHYDPDGRITQTVDDACVQQARRGSVMVFPGALHRDDPSDAVVHRSPHCNAQRIVLTMDIAR
ncbi:MAG: DUF1826 domain-containing protein [Pseudomonadota bacterium]